jgi:hypothetical protein
MSTIEHIMYRHSANSGFKNVSRFAEETTVRDIRDYVDEALRYGTVTSTQAGRYTIEHNLRRTIGTDQVGNPAHQIRVHVNFGIIRTAFPI